MLSSVIVSGVTALSGFSIVKANQPQAQVEQIAYAVPQTTPVATPTAIVTPVPTLAPTPKVTPNYAKAIDSFLKNKLSGKGQLFLDMQKKYKVNAFLVAAICIHESGNGTSEVCRKFNNVAGLMIEGTSFMNFETVDKSIEKTFEILKKYYIDEGLDSIDKIQPKYCPVGALNDPSGLNKHWLPNVTKLYEEIRNKALGGA